LRLRRFRAEKAPLDRALPVAAEPAGAEALGVADGPLGHGGRIGAREEGAPQCAKDGGPTQDE